MEKIENFFFKIRNKISVTTLTILFNIILQVQARVIRQVKEVKAIQTKKKEVNLFLHADDTFLYVETLKDIIKNLITHQQI